MRILFQGDSITDGGRNRNEYYNLGVRYPLHVKSALCFEQPLKYEFINRGISGDRIVDIYARIKRDIISLKPDVMSILVGVNDVWHEVNEQIPNGVDNNKFFKIYSMLIEEIKEALPDIKIMIMEPFVLKGSNTEENWEYFKIEVPKRAKMARRIAEKYDLIFIPLQNKFDEAVKSAPASYWLADGVHPTEQGSEMIKREWLKGFDLIK